MYISICYISLIRWAPSASSSASDTFIETLTGEPLWISEVDAGSYFILGRQYLKLLSDVRGGRGGFLGHTKHRYFLFHVYDLVKTHASKDIADEALAKFLEKNEQREWEIYGMLGLGAGECCGPGWND